MITTIINLANKSDNNWWHFFQKIEQIIKNYQVNTTARQRDRKKEKQKKVQKNHLILIFFNILLLF